MTDKVECWLSSLWAKIVAGLLCAILVVWLGNSMRRQVVRAGKRHNNDFECFMIGGRAILNGEDIYEVRTEQRERWFAFPQWFAMFMVPFELMGYTAASIAWPLLNLAALAGSCYWCLKLARGPDAPVRWPLLIVPALLVLRPLDSNFGNGQVNVLILALTCLGLYLYQKRRDTWAGVSLAAATLMKVTPALLIVYFAWKREWRVVIGAAIGAIVLTLIVPVPLFGLRGGFDGTRKWIEERILVSTEGVQHDGYVPGQSLRTILYRTLTDSKAGSHTERDIRVNIASMEPEIVEIISKACAIGLILLLGLLTFGRGDRDDVPRTAAEISLVLGVMLLASPYSRKAHFVLLMLPMTFAWSRLARGELKRCKFLLGTIIACFVLTSLTAEFPFGEVASEYFVALTCLGWGTLLLMLGIGSVLIGMRA